MASENGGGAMKRPKRQAALAATIPISRIFKEDEESTKSRMLKKLKSSHNGVYDVTSSANSSSKSSLKLGNCFLCGTPAPQCVFVSNIGECMTRVTRKKMLDALVQIAATDAEAVNVVKSSDLELELICVSCENIVHEIDTLEVKCRLMKDSVVGLILRKSGKNKNGKTSEDLVPPEANFFNLSLVDQGVFVEGVNVKKMQADDRKPKLENMPPLVEIDFEGETKFAFDGSTLAEQCMNLLTKIEQLDVASEREVKSESAGNCGENRPGKVPDFTVKQENVEPVVVEGANEVQEVASTSKRVSLKTWNGRRSQMKNIDKPVEEDELCPEGVQRAPELICCVCGRYFETMKDRLSHERAHEEPPPHRCPFCDEVRNCRKELKQHVKDVHLQEKPLICTHCGDTFVDKRKLQFHLDSLSANADRPFVCTWPGCHEAFTVQGDLDVHVAEHSMPGGNSYQCKECGKTYRQLRSLKQHSLSHSAFACKACPQVFMDKKAFIQHVMDAHSGDEKKYVPAAAPKKSAPVLPPPPPPPPPPPQTQIIATVVSISSDPRSPLKTKIRVNGHTQITGATAPKVPKIKVERDAERRTEHGGSRVNLNIPVVQPNGNGHYPCPMCGLMSADAACFRAHYDTCARTRNVVKIEPIVAKTTAAAGKKKRRMNKTGWPSAPRPSLPSVSSSSSSSSSLIMSRADHAYPVAGTYSSFPSPSTSLLAARLQGKTPAVDPYSFE